MLLWVHEAFPISYLCVVALKRKGKRDEIYSKLNLWLTENVWIPKDFLNQRRGLYRLLVRHMIDWNNRKHTLQSSKVRSILLYKHVLRSKPAESQGYRHFLQLHWRQNHIVTDTLLTLKLTNILPTMCATASVLQVSSCLDMEKYVFKIMYMFNSHSLLSSLILVLKIAVETMNTCEVS